MVPLSAISSVVLSGNGCCIRPTAKVNGYALAVVLISRTRALMQEVCCHVIKTVSVLVDGGFVRIADARNKLPSRADVTDLQWHGIHRGDRPKWVPQDL